MVPFNPDRKFKNRKVEPETMDRIYDMVKTPYKIGPVIKYDEFLTDSPSIFKHKDSWYMLYITISKDVNVSGYETHLAKSEDLINWEQYCTILRRNDKNRWDSKQCAGYAAFVDVEFGKTNEIRKVNDRYYFSYLAGNSDGYEPDPLYMGLAYFLDPTDPTTVTRLEEPILRPDDVDAREYERRTLYKSYLFEDIDGITGYKYVNAYNAKDESNKERIYLAVSNDAVRWERYGDTPVIDDIKDNPGVRISGDPQIVKIDDIYIMFYFIREEGKGAYNTFACSYDLVEWTKWRGSPLIQSEYEWENIYAHKPWVLKDNEVVYHFYCAVNKNGERFIALATSKPLQK
jgi:predicted GH43/DUF377 family glycosyl hydrolase